ncbi:NifB/NifX family molybdenum-iron cluster-binding protein [Feifania hominis]|uniref:NifB/NifX family molybdenum-iron cluster-binding protein n=1 Tax=Feifania hominis TaxID=2763660 RepID=A0A926HQK8_9FIRM|nr:NifB/NifX family molybdenum-iron cluster-binding protein [Feifania hominis]MBC8536447.1 NifB/NifX family molybdenum-iron cluster-binding protein [Feifania hominis]
MKIAVAAETEEVFGHFGKCGRFLLYTVEDGAITGREELVTAAHGHSALPPFLKEHGAQVVLCGGMGEGARNGLGFVGIKAVSGVTGPADEAVRAYVAGTLTDGGVTCGHHHDHGHEHGEGHCHGHGEGHCHDHGEGHTCQCGSH